MLRRIRQRIVLDWCRLAGYALLTFCAMGAARASVDTILRPLMVIARVSRLCDHRLMAVTRLKLVCGQVVIQLRHELDFRN